MSEREPLRVVVSDLIADAREPFLVPDVTPPGASPAAVFHIVRDLVDDGVLARSHDGYWRVWLAEAR